MTKQPFQVGEVYEFDGLRYRVTQGRKGPDDQRLEVESASGWTPVRMATGAMMADFFVQNENRLYPPQYGYRGGSYYVNFVLAAVRHGWQAAVAQLELERRQREQRRRGEAA